MKEQEVVLVQEGAHWQKIQTFAQNAVVQVFAQVAKFNWLEPYNVHEQYENRGSGFFINDAGYLVTNAHVVSQAQHVWIQIPVLGQEPIEVDVIGVCPERDLALLKLKDPQIEYVKKAVGTIPFLIFGNSDELRPTDGILSLGYPLGQYRLKSSTGVVSGYAATLGQSLIQVTSPINPGSSGGPLLNARGEVIGITVAGVLNANNVGYAIPINELSMIIEDLHKNKLVRKPFLGVRFSFANDEQAQFLNNPSPAGLYVAMVLKGSLFEKAGIQKGDMLYEWNGLRIDAYGDARVPWRADKTSLYDLLSRTNRGDTINLVLFRNGERKEVSCVFELVESDPIRAMFPGIENIEYEVIGGLIIMELKDNHLIQLLPLNPQLQKYMEPENKKESVLVITHVMPGSYGHQIRILKAGDIITRVNEKNVKTLADFRRSIDASKTTGFVVLHTQMDVMAVMKLDRVLSDEDRLSKSFAYPTSPTIMKLKGK